MALEFLADDETLDKLCVLPGATPGLQSDVDLIPLLVNKYSRDHLLTGLSADKVYSIHHNDPLLGIPLAQHMCPLTLPSDKLLDELQDCDVDIMASVLALRPGNTMDDYDMGGDGDIHGEEVDENLFGLPHLANRRFFKFETAAPSRIHDTDLTDCKDKKTPSRELQIRQLKMLTFDHNAEKVYFLAESSHASVVAHLDLMTNVSSSMLAWSVSAASFATCPILNHDFT